MIAVNFIGQNYIVILFFMGAIALLLAWDKKQRRAILRASKKNIVKTSYQFNLNHNQIIKRIEKLDLYDFKTYNLHESLYIQHEINLY